MRKMGILLIILSFFCNPLLSLDLTSIFFDFGSLNFGTVDFSHGSISISFGDILIPSVPALSFPPAFGVLFRFNSSSIFKGFDDVHDITGFSLIFGSFTFSGYSMRSVGPYKLDERAFGILINSSNDFIKLSASVGVKERHESGEEKIDEMEMPWIVSVKMDDISFNISRDSYNLRYDMKMLPLSFTLRKNCVDSLFRITKDHRIKLSTYYSFSRSITLTFSVGMNGRIEIFGYPVNYIFDVKKDGMDLSIRSRNLDLSLKDMKPSLVVKANVNNVDGMVKFDISGKQLRMEGSIGYEMRMDNLSMNPVLRMKDDGFTFTLDFAYEW